MLSLNGGGYFLLLLSLLIYVVLAVTLGDYLPDHWAVQTLFYAVIGLLWIYPAIKILDWFHKSGRKGQEKE